MDTKIYLPHQLQSHPATVTPTSQDKTPTTMLPRSYPTRPYEYHGQLRRFPKKEIVGLLTKFHFPKRRVKPWKREVHLLEKFFSENIPARDSFFKVRKKGHIGVIPHHHTIMRTKEQMQGRWGRSVEVDGGDLVEGE